MHKKSTLKVVGVLMERMVDGAGLSLLVCMQGAALEVVWSGLPRKGQEVTRSVKKRQEASSGFYKHLNAFLCMFHSKMDHI